MAVIGHILCGICDCLLSYSKKGRLDLKDIKDQDKMAAMFADMPLSNPLISIVLGTFATFRLRIFCVDRLYEKLF